MLIGEKNIIINRKKVSTEDLTGAFPKVNMKAILGYLN